MSCDNLVDRITGEDISSQLFGLFADLNVRSPAVDSSAMNESVNTELDVTSALLSGVLRDHSIQAPTNSSNHHNHSQKKDDSIFRQSVLHNSSPSPKSVIALNPSPVRKTAPFRPLPGPYGGEPSEMDASNWPLLNLTNPPTPPIHHNGQPSHTLSYRGQYIRAPGVAMPVVPPMMHNQMRIPFEVRQPERRRGRPPSSGRRPQYNPQTQHMYPIMKAMPPQYISQVQHSSRPPISHSSSHPTHHYHPYNMAVHQRPVGRPPSNPCCNPSSFTQQQRGQIPVPSHHFINMMGIDPQRRVTVDPKQISDVRDKVQAIASLSHQKTGPNYQWTDALVYRQTGVSPNMADMRNKERAVENILDGRFANGNPYTMGRVIDRSVLGHPNMNPNGMASGMTRLGGRPNEQGVEILRSALSQNGDLHQTSPNIRANPYSAESFESFCRNQNQAQRNYFPFPPDAHNSFPLTSSPPKTGQTDILVQAMEEIVECVEVTDDQHINGENSVEVSEESSEQTGAEDKNPVVYISIDENAQNLTGDALLQYLKDQGWEVSDTNSQQSQSSDSSTEPKTCNQTEEDLVIHIDEKMLAEVADNNSAEVIIVIDENSQTANNPDQDICDQTFQTSKSSHSTNYVSMPTFSFGPNQKTNNASNGDQNLDKPNGTQINNSEECDPILFDNCDSEVELTDKNDKLIDEEMVTNDITRDQDISVEESRNEVTRDEVFRDEVFRDEVISDEVIRDEVIRDEVIRVEVIRDEVIRDEVTRDEVTRDEVTRDEAIRDEAIRDEAIRDEAIRDEAIRDEAIRDEVIRDQVTRDERTREEQTRDEGTRDKVTTEEVNKDEVAKDNVLNDKYKSDITDNDLEKIGDNVTIDPNKTNDDTNVEQSVDEDNRVNPCHTIDLNDESDSSSLDSIVERIETNTKDFNLEAKESQNRAQNIDIELEVKEVVEDLTPTDSQTNNNKEVTNSVTNNTDNSEKCDNSDKIVSHNEDVFEMNKDVQNDYQEYEETIIPNVDNDDLIIETQQNNTEESNRVMKPICAKLTTICEIATDNVLGSHNDHGISSIEETTPFNIYGIDKSFDTNHKSFVGEQKINNSLPFTTDSDDIIDKSIADLAKEVTNKERDVNDEYEIIEKEEKMKDVIEDNTDDNVMQTEIEDIEEEVEEDEEESEDQQNDTHITDCIIVNENDLNENNRSEDRDKTEKTEPKTTDPIEVIPSETIQHPFVSSSVENYMPNTPSTPSSDVGSPLVTKSPVVQKKLEPRLESLETGIENQDNRVLDIDLDSDDDVIPLPTTTTSPTLKHNILYLNGVQSEVAFKTPAKDNLIISEVPLSCGPSVDRTLPNHSKKSKKSEKRKTKSGNKPPKKKMMTEEEECKYLQIIRSRLTGWERGWTPKEIVGVNNLNKNLVFLVKWTNDEQTIVLSETAKQKCPQLVIKFYEEHSVWDD